MKKARFTTEQVVAILQEDAAGAEVTELTRRHGISKATQYHWKIAPHASPFAPRPRPPSSGIRLLEYYFLKSTAGAAFASADWISKYSRGLAPLTFAVTPAGIATLAACYGLFASGRL